ncbi:hypothetical protein [Paludisphaera rhizosphaerae]|uniref:hypothetical protein n=1 Tax=Paludisphaera rhizosphaerae TaxID=2711216 RepID=UPI0013ECDED6|nr:hypothetical protein [Paludisphaera rhizosphaerae]
MKDAPEFTDGEKVILFTSIDRRHRPTGNCRQVVAGVLQGPAAGLMICQYEGEKGYYLFGCDANWCAITDTYHQSIEEAMSQAEFEYEGVTETWRRHA